jgi:hypothetical protein
MATNPTTDKVTPSASETKTEAQAFFIQDVSLIATATKNGTSERR